MHDEQDLAGSINRRGFLGTGAGAVADRGSDWDRSRDGSAVGTQIQNDAIGCVAQAHTRSHGR